MRYLMLAVALASSPSCIWAEQIRDASEHGISPTTRALWNHTELQVVPRVLVSQDSGRLSEAELDFLKKADRINQKVKQDVANEKVMTDKFVEQIPAKEIITIDEAVSRYNLDRDYNREKDLIVVFNGDLIIHSWNDEWINSQLKELKPSKNVNGFVIVGNLTVNYDVVDGSSFSSVHVLRNLSARNVFSHDGHIRIRGNANIRYGIYGEYNDGSFAVGGELHTPYIIAGDHDMPRSTASDSIYIEARNGSDREDVAVADKYTGTMGWGWTYFKNSHRLLSQNVWDGENKFSVGKFFNLVRQGENPFLSKAN